MKITLGTVQFGLDYGITNNTGKPSFEEIKKILTVAQNNGIHQLDTAPSYGNAEQRLGTMNLDEFSLYTKTPHFEKAAISIDDLGKLRETFSHSLKQLNVNRVEGLLIHNVSDCYKTNSYLLFESLQELKQQNKVRKIGVSVYEPKDIEMILNHNLPVDIIQLPMNILDQRIVQTDLLYRLKTKNIEVHARSVFLQGILLGDQATIPKEKYGYVKNYFDDLNQYGLTKLEAALLFIQQIDEIDFVLLGVNSITNLEQIIEALKKIKIWDRKIDFSKYACHEISMIDPRRW